MPEGKLPIGDRVGACLEMRGLTDAEKLVLISLSWCDGPRGCFPAMQSIAKRLGRSRRTICKHVKALAEKGKLTVQRGRHSNRYVIHYEKSHCEPRIHSDTVNHAFTRGVNTGFAQTGKNREKGKGILHGGRDYNTGDEHEQSPFL